MELPTSPKGNACINWKREMITSTVTSESWGERLTPLAAEVTPLVGRAPVLWLDPTRWRVYLFFFFLGWSDVTLSDSACNTLPARTKQRVGYQRSTQQCEDMWVNPTISHKKVPQLILSASESRHFFRVRIIPYVLGFGCKSTNAQPTGWTSSRTQYNSFIQTKPIRRWFNPLLHCSFCHCCASSFVIHLNSFRESTRNWEKRKGNCSRLGFSLITGAVKRDHSLQLNIKPSL